MSAQDSTMLPYLEGGKLRYAEAPVPASQEDKTCLAVVETASITSGATLVNNEEEVQRFTATGRPLPAYKSSGWANHPGDGFVANPAQSLPMKYTDDSIISISVPVVTSKKPKCSDEAVQPPPKKKSFAGKMLSVIGGGDSSSKSAGGSFKVVNMPRGEYLKHFAKDDHGTYIGTEPQREWTAEEVETRYGQYKKEIGKGVVRKGSS